VKNIAIEKQTDESAGSVETGRTVRWFNKFLTNRIQNPRESDMNQPVTRAHPLHEAA
jgi:hypothetical protein